MILFYTKGKGFTWNTPREPHSEEYVAGKYRYDDGDGRKYQLDNMTSPNPRPNMMYAWKGFPYPDKGWRYSQETMARLDEEGRIWYPTNADGSLDPSRRPRLKRYLEEMEGGVMGTVWTDISPLNSQAQERLGYPTQKPLSLLERILTASSNPGDLVLDPFCGCGTTVHAAEKLGRSWIGIDITHLAISLVERRLQDAFAGTAFEVFGVPTDFAGARDLAVRDKHEFQKWATAQLEAQPYKGGRKGMDRGIDGFIHFRDADRKPQTGIVSVKGGENVTSSMIRDLKGTVDREKAALGVFFSLVPPTREMVKEAAAAGFYETGGRRYPKIQIITAEEALAGKKPQLPFGHSEGFRKAAAEKGATDQMSLI